MVAGLKALRGVGGERVIIDRYRAQSQRMRAAGIEVERTQSWLQSLRVLLPGAFLVLIIWCGADLAIAHQITAGQLTTFYGFAAFLSIPLRTGVEAAQAFLRGAVAASRVLAVHGTRAATAERTETVDAPPHGARIVDISSGVVIDSSLFTALMDADQDEAAAVATRLGRFDDDVNRAAPVL